VLFLADAQDEFRWLNTSWSGFTVQISGLSRMGFADRMNCRPRGGAAAAPSGAASESKRVAADPGFPGLSAARSDTDLPGGWGTGLRGKSVRIMSLAPTGTAATSASGRNMGSGAGRWSERGRGGRGGGTGKGGFAAPVEGWC